MEAGFDLEKLVGAAWDHELEAWRLPADRLSGAKARISDAGGRIADEIGQPAKLEGPWQIPPLRWYQDAAIDAWSEAGHRGVIALPTGSGKTLAAIAAIARIGIATLVIVPTRVLLDQWARALAAAWPFPIGRLGDGDHRIMPITVATYASAVGWGPRIGDRFGMLVVDEAHHVGSWCAAELFEMSCATVRLGLTATPPEPRGPLAQHVGDVVYALSVADLVGDALAAYTTETIAVELARDELAQYRETRGVFAREFASFARSRPHANWREFVALARRTVEGREALAAWRASRAVIAYPVAKQRALRELLAKHAGDRVLVFTADNATAYAITRELLVMPITCDIGRKEREQMLHRFRTGEANVLVSSQVLDEGLDVPDAEVAIIVGGTASARRHVQRVGRVLRPRPGKRAFVYELAARATTEIQQLATRRRALDREDGRPTGPHSRGADAATAAGGGRGSTPRASEAPTVLRRRPSTARVSEASTTLPTAPRASALHAAGRASEAETTMLPTAPRASALHEASTTMLPTAPRASALHAAGRASEAGTTVRDVGRANPATVFTLRALHSTATRARTTAGAMVERRAPYACSGLEVAS